MCLDDLISVVIPIYNVQDYLEECVESVLNQTHTNLEVILVDNGSTDNCPEICDHYAQIDSRVKVIHQPNMGLVGARKVGLSLASGNYVACVDGDDWIEPEMYGELFAAMMCSNADIVIAGHKEDLLGSIEIMHNTVPCGVYSGASLVDVIYHNMLCNGNFSQFGVYSYLWNKLFKKDVLLPNQMRVNNSIFIGEDAACLYPTLLEANVVCVTDNCSYHYRQRPNSMVKTPEKYEVEYRGIHTLYQYLRGIFRKSVYAESLISQLELYILSLITVRSDCLLHEDRHLSCLFPFSKVKTGSKVALVGAGTFGQHLYRRLIANPNFSCVLWADFKYEQYQMFDLPVSPVDSLLNSNYDVVIIGYIDVSVADSVRSSLIGMGVDKDKLEWIDYDFNNPSEILKGFGL